MDRAISEMEGALKTLDKPGPWSPDIKASEEFLEPLFKKYFKALDLYNLMGKTNFHQLARFVPRELIDHEVIEKLDIICEVARSAKGNNHK